jgi:RNA polymerase sigma factor (sigma-70 family)
MDDQTGISIPSEELRKLYGSWIKRTAMFLKARMPWAELDELKQLGAVGMLEALSRYDPSFGVGFQAFAARRIRGAMIDGMRREGVQRRGQSHLDDDTVNLVDTAAVIAGTSPEDPLSQLVRSDTRTKLAAALATLPPLEFRILSLHFYDEMNNREIAAILDMSEGYASRIRKRALEKLAQQLAPQFTGENV